jgi:hypothetical protein
MTDIKKLRELLAKATPGPWVVDEDNREGYKWNNHIVNNEGRIAFMAHKPGDNEQWEAAAHLIVAAVNALPALLDEVERLREAAGPFLEEWLRRDHLKPGPDIDDWLIGGSALTYGDLRRLARAVKGEG